MPYTASDYPDTIKGLPAHARDIWIAAFNSAFETYADRGDRREALAFATAWAAVRKSYRQEGDQWVAKEASMSDLQRNYAEIIQEAGRRNASSDLTRIKKIVELCQELLSSEVEDEEKTQEALRESESVLAWLKEQDAMKTEDGEKFPSAAFAYAPDPEAPSEWKLRMWENPEQKVTRRQLGLAAAALSPGGFRGQRVEIPSADLPAVKRKIRAAYRGLDVADEDIPRWVKEAQERSMVYEYIPVLEVDSKGIAPIVIVRPGFNESKERYYTPESLRRGCALFEGVKMYADHATEAERKARPEGSVKTWAANLKNVHIDESGCMVGDAIIIEGWLKEKLELLKQNNLLSEMGTSINAVGRGPKDLVEIEGHKTRLVEDFVRVYSVDFVTEAGAGGMVLLYESDQEVNIDLVGLSILRERRPDLVKEVEEAIKEQAKVEVKRTMELQEQVGALTIENEALKGQIEEARKATAIAETKATVDKALSESELPGPAQARLTERFANAENTDGLEEAIKAEKTYIDSIRESGKVKNMGGGGPEKVNEAIKEALKEAFRNLDPSMTDRQVEIAAEGR